MADELFDEPLPPPDNGEHLFDVEHTIDLFEQAGRQDDLVWALSTALCSLQECALSRRGDGRHLTCAQRSRLLAATERAYLAAWRSLPASYPREQISQGMRAAVDLVEHWARPRVLGRDNPLRDAIDLARCFRNDLHNMSLRIGLEARLLRRQKDQKTIEELFGADPVAPPAPPIAFVSQAA
jgi:hypothetical protein